MDEAREGKGKGEGGEEGINKLKRILMAVEGEGNVRGEGGRQGVR